MSGDGVSAIRAAGGQHFFPGNKCGNRCGHDPRTPKLRPLTPIRQGKGAPPRILSLAAERARAWYDRPGMCPPLQSSDARRTRSERREAIVVVLETLLARLDLASLCCGAPTLAQGFIDVDMRTLVRDSGLGQRRIERAIAHLKDAGFMQVTQPRGKSEEGRYFGCRAIRVMKESLFEWLGLGPMLRRERARASERLRRKAQRANRKLADFMRRTTSNFRSPPPLVSKASIERNRAWSQEWGRHVAAGCSIQEAQRRTNAAFGLPPDFSPGKG